MLFDFRDGDMSGMFGCMAYYCGMFFFAECFVGGFVFGNGAIARGAEGC